MVDIDYTVLEGVMVFYVQQHDLESTERLRHTFQGPHPTSRTIEHHTHYLLACVRDLR